MPLTELCSRLNISVATARRDLAALARDKVITRTRGGALVDFNQRFPSFRERQFRASLAKRQMALVAIKLIKPGTTVFLDAGTTTYAIAEALTVQPVSRVTVVTNNLPVAEMLTGVQDMEIHVVGGQYLARQSVLFGEQARRCLRLWKLDLAFIGGEGMTQAGLWNSQKDVVAFQKTVVELSPRTICCLDSTKLGQEAPEFLLPWAEVDALLTDVTAEQLKAAGIKLAKGQLITAS
ncbi:MAG: HTH-type transcriptional repressor GlcR [Verrucomicrobiae bacterium]|nr:HTH-type transcriptional repressor GlcR [Verrucomicrobiae bacterium]